MATKKSNTQRSSRVSKRKAPSRGRIYVHASFNNTIITATDEAGNTVLWISAGRHQKGARKSTGHAAEVVAEELAKQLVTMGMAEVSIYLNGTGNGRESSVRGVINGGLKVTTLIENTADQHAGCRLRKVKRS